MSIELGRDFSKAPATTCPRCKKDLHLMVDAFKPDIAKIVRTNCPFCNVEMYAGLMIFVNVNLNGLLGNIQAVVDLFEEKGANITTVDNPDGKVIQ